MPPRKELCRNFQRGSCQYGDNCKFLHATPQQSKTNPLGFGGQQQVSNPFGFGVQNNSYTTGRNDFGSKPNQFKPFENKWTRDSSRNASSATASRQSNSQPHEANHKCNDPESCKHIMVEDFENEMRPWKLTCYGHSRNGPCDIVGDISCEELRALAYDDAKRGLSLHSIIDREKSLVNSKLVEFQNLVHKPYVVSPDATPSSQSPFAGTSSNAINISRGVSPSVSSFSQLNASMNTRSGMRPSCQFDIILYTLATVNSIVGLLAYFQILCCHAPSRSAGTPNFAFGLVSPLQNTSNNSSGTFVNQIPHQAVQSSFSFGSATPSNSVMNANRNPFSTSSNSSQMANVADSNMNTVSNVPNIRSNAIGQSSISIHDNLPKVNTNVDNGIWNKAEWKWNIGEIPEEEPPSNCIY